METSSIESSFFCEVVPVVGLLASEKNLRTTWASVRPLPLLFEFIVTLLLILLKSLRVRDLTARIDDLSLVETTILKQPLFVIDTIPIQV